CERQTSTFPAARNDLVGVGALRCLRVLSTKTKAHSEPETGAGERSERGRDHGTASGKDGTDRVEVKIV
ncbi:MAG: hypothetical protein AAFX06_08520, partial [Planctomycetota bacterium]